MNIRLVCVGKIKEKYLMQGISEYTKRLSRYAKIEMIQVEDEKRRVLVSCSSQMVKEKEGLRLKAYSGGCDENCIGSRGQSLSSEGFPTGCSNMDYQDKAGLTLS